MRRGKPYGGSSISSQREDLRHSNAGAVAVPRQGQPSGLIDLAQRESQGIHVVLWWNRPTGELVVSVLDGRTGVAFVVPAAAKEALEVFCHPDAFVPARHLLHRDVESVDDAPLEREAA
jgi:hypothetical protein